MKNKFFFWALWAGAVISANAAFVFFTLAGSDEAAAAWTLSFFALCCVVAVEVMQKRDKPASGCAMWTLRCLWTLLLAFMLRSGGLPLAVGGCFFACRRYAVVCADFRYRQVKTGVASD